MQTAPAAASTVSTVQRAQAAPPAVQAKPARPAAGFPDGAVAQCKDRIFVMEPDTGGLCSDHGGILMMRK